MKFKIGEKVKFNKTHPNAPAHCHPWKNTMEGEFEVLDVIEVPADVLVSTGHTQWLQIADSPGVGDTFSGLYFESDEYLENLYEGKRE
jgi:hypothetical protein